MSDPRYTVIYERDWHENYGGAVEYDVVRRGLTAAEADDLEAEIMASVNDEPSSYADHDPSYVDNVFIVTDEEGWLDAWRWPT